MYYLIIYPHHEMQRNGILKYLLGTDMPTDDDLSVSRKAVPYTRTYTYSNSMDDGP